MRARLHWAVPAVLGVSLACQPAARAAAAEDPPEEVGPRPRARRSAVYFDFGLGTPVGLKGIEVTRRVGQSFELSAGVGLGLAAQIAQPNAGLGDLVQWAVMPRLRFGGDRSAVTLGAGLSGGEFAHVVGLDVDGGAGSTRDTLYDTLWANLELGGEQWSRGGFAFRYYVGLAHGTMLSAPSRAGSPVDVPYLGLGVGYAF
jgi:hypothetical protein